MAIDGRLLLQRLLKAKVGEVITYQELSQEIDRDVQREANGCLQSALRAAVRQMIVFGTIRNVGVKRLTDRELAGVGEATRQHISRSARMALMKMAAVQDFNSLNNAEKIRHNTSMAMLGAVAHISSPSQVRALEGRVTASMGVLPVQKTLAAFMEKAEDTATKQTSDGNKSGQEASQPNFPEDKIKRLAPGYAIGADPSTTRRF